MAGVEEQGGEADEEREEPSHARRIHVRAIGVALPEPGMTGCPDLLLEKKTMRRHRLAFAPPRRCWILLALLAVCALAPRPAGAAPDPAIAALVAQIDPDRYEAHLAALAGQRATAQEREAARAYIQQQLESFGYAVQVDATENVSALRPGSISPDVRFVVGAHHDSVFGSPGADDNASGVAAVLEIARVLAGAELESSVEIVSFGLEEIGLVGSFAYSAAAGAADRDIRGVLVFDMIGYTAATQSIIPPTIPGCFTTSETAGQDPAGDWIGMVANTLPLRDAYLAARAEYVPALRVEWGTVADGTGQCFPFIPGFGNLLRRSDHVGFWDQGYGALFLTDTAELRNPNYHQGTDTIASLNLPFAVNVTRASLAFLLSAARPLAGPDVDGDGVANADDNCPFVANAGQEDTGGLGAGSPPNGRGDACECGDVSGDGRVTTADAALIQRALLAPPAATLVRPALCDVGGAPGCSIADAAIVQRALLTPPKAEIAERCARPAP